MHFTKHSHRNLFCAAILAVVSVGAVGCDEGQAVEGRADQPSFVKLGRGFGFAGKRAEGDAASEVRERKGSFLPPKTTTKPHEPGGGYFDIDENDPENKTYFSTCAPYEDDLGIKTITEVVVDPATKELKTYALVTAIPDWIELYNNEGEIVQVGDRLNLMSACTYNSSYADCEESEDVIELTFMPDLDAKIVIKTDSQQYWDYGQNRFRELGTFEQRCEGTDCDDPYVLDMFGDPVDCWEIGMTVNVRVPEPVFE